jgi:hypothetical protein
MSAIEIALHKTVRSIELPVANSTSMRLRGWIAAHAIDLADMIAGVDQGNDLSGKAGASANPWVRPIGLARTR